jgi:hypothetical protein
MAKVVNELTVLPVVPQRRVYSVIDWASLQTGQVIELSRDEDFTVKNVPAIKSQGRAHLERTQDYVTEFRFAIVDDNTVRVQFLKPDHAGYVGPTVKAPPKPEQPAAV